MATRSARPRITDVARLADVSVTAVSLVLNRKTDSGIPSDTQARILAAAAELGYRPNAIARGLRSGRSQTIGFVSDVIATTPFAGAMIVGAQEAAWAAGKLLLLINTGRDPAIEARGFELLHDRQVDGLIYATMFHRVIDPPGALRDGAAVLLDARAADESLPSVVPDEVAAAREATAELIRFGHRRIGYIQFSEPIPAAPERAAGYAQALLAADIPFDPRLVAAGEATAQGGWEAAGTMLDMPDPPSALFCFNDQMAMGAYRAIAERRLRIPHDVSVIGFDDQVLIAPWLVPGLTTMALPHYEMGRWAVERLIGEPGDTLEPVQHRMACRMIRRESVAPPPAWSRS